MTEPITLGGDAEGTLATNGVNWFVEPTSGHFTCSTGPQTWVFDRPVDLRFGITQLNAPGEGVQLPEGAEVESIDELHAWDPETRVVSRVSDESQDRVSVFTLSNVTELELVADGGCGWSRGAAFIEVTADVPNEPPTATITGPQDGAEYYVGQDVEAAFACEAVAADQTIETCEGTVPEGEAIDTANVGTRMFTVRAVDSAGNEGFETATYTVRKSRTSMRAEPLVTQVLPVTSHRGLLNLAPLARVSLTYEGRVADEGGRPVAGVPVEFDRCTATTDTDGVATCGAIDEGLGSILDLGYAANFRGDDRYEPSGNLGHLIEVLGIGLL
ncbi:MAG: hypothetical protein AB7G37_11430 [Solirubrobacteraceae bacterium]